MVLYPTLTPKMFLLTVGKYTIRGALWSWHAVDAVRAAFRVVSALWSGHRSAVGMPLQGAGGRVLLAVRVVCTVWSDAGGAQVAAAGAA